MYLKSLVLKGFKTFSDKTEIEFGAGASITGIVGPNGCGKSNILDAVRWVLGEQSIKALRATLQEEIIFAGTQERRPLSMGEVSLCFDNSDHLLPIDFAEVAIRRRIFREGESEFSINKSACRLKDIKDLLMDTGLGANSYSIINQGEVDAILASSPEDRRGIFEEVAGINRYRIRKEAAEKKLINVEQHLLRLSDLKTEIGEQLLHLEEQARRAREYQESRVRLKELEIALCKKQLQSFTERSEECQQTIRALGLEIENTAKEKEAAHQKRQEIRGKVRALEAEERGVRDELTRGSSREEIRNRIFAKERELAEARNSLRDLEEKERLAQYEIEKTSPALQRLEHKLADASPKRMALEAEIVSVRQNLSEAQQTLQIKSRGDLPEEAEGYLLEQLCRHLSSLEIKMESLLENISSQTRANTLEEFLAGKDQLVVSLSKIGEISQTIKNLSLKVKEISLTKKASKEELSSLQAGEKELSGALLAREFAFNAFLAETEQALDQLELYKKTIEVRGQEIGEQKGQKLILTEKISVGEQEKQLLEESLSKGIEDLTAKLEAFSKKREELETEIDAAESQGSQLESQEMRLRSELNRAEIQIAKLEGEAQSIGGRIWEEYNISLQEVLEYPHEIAVMSKAKEEISGLRSQIHSLEPVNLLAIDEFSRTKERLGVIENGYLDLISSRENLNSLIVELDKKARESFATTIEVVGRNFSEIFSGLFVGGEAEIRLVGEEDVMHCGVEIYARPSGRKMLTLSALSGGERALTAISLLFALLKTHPTPFCFLDEVDAPLDDANIHRFTKLLKVFSSQMQIVVITHNKNTMAAADRLYGITMEEPGISKIISMKLTQVV